MTPKNRIISGGITAILGILLVSGGFGGLFSSGNEFAALVALYAGGWMILIGFIVFLIGLIGIYTQRVE
jgi:hypothetical protein